MKMQGLNKIMHMKAYNPLRSSFGMSQDETGILGKVVLVNLMEWPFSPVWS